MPYPLLATKLFFPPLRSDRVFRPRLVEKMNAAILPGRRLVLISAPAGFGKTTLAAEWARQTGMPVGWLAVDEGDNDPARFWHYISAALQTIFSDLGTGMVDALDSPQPPPLQSILTLLINDLSTRPQPFLLVVDDFHLLDLAEIHDQFNFFMDHLPPNAHLVLLTRSDPPLHLARRRARGEICELRAADLRFSAAEIQEFLTRTMGLYLNHQDVSALENRTEGWIAGLQLAAISLQGRTDAHELVSSFTGDDRYIADYLVEEVLQHQPAPIREFLLKTSILERMCAPLCEALLQEEANRGGMQGILSQLDQSNLFVIPLDNRREWFRYHHLFGDLLRQRLGQELSPAEIRGLYRRASSWHLKSQLMSEAMEYAIASSEDDFIRQTLGEAMPWMFYQGDLNSLTRWAERIPAGVLDHATSYCLGLGWAANATGHLEVQDRLLSLVEAHCGMTVEQFLDLSQPEADNLPPETLALLVEAASQRARLAMDMGKVDQVIFRFAKIMPYLDRPFNSATFNLPSNLMAPMLFLISMARWVKGDLIEAEAGFREALQSALKTNNSFVVSLANGNLGNVQAALGRLTSAEATYREALKQQESGHQAAGPFYGVAWVGLAGLEYERNHLDAARTAFAEGLRLARIWNNAEGLIPGYIGLARTHWASGDPEAAFETLESLEHTTLLVPGAKELAAACRASFHIQRGELEPAAQWARTAGVDSGSISGSLNSEQVLVLGTLLTAQGKPELAAALLKPHLEKARQSGALSQWMKVAANLTCALTAENQDEAALDLLERMLDLAEQEGYCRVFLDAGEWMHQALAQYVQSGRPNQPKALELLKALAALAEEPRVPDPVQPEQTALVDPLSQRELEILALLASGASNAEIAEQTVITINTVKKHIGSIYGKLGVTTRMRAVEKAKQLKLI